MASSASLASGRHATIVSHLAPRTHLVAERPLDALPAPANRVLTTNLMGFPSVADACSIEGHPTANFGSTIDMWAGYDEYLDPPGKLVRSLIRFDLSALPADTQIVSATLRLSLMSSWDYPNAVRTITAYRVTSPWSEATVTWQNIPSFAEAHGSAEIMAGAWDWYAFDVTNLVRGWVSGAYHNHGLLLRGPEVAGHDSSWRGFATRESDAPPELLVSWSQRNNTNAQVVLPLVVNQQPPSHIPVSSVLTPFDARVNDLGGPTGWWSNYGKTPEIIVASNGTSLAVLAQDYNPDTPWNAVLLRVEPSSSGYRITQALTGMPMLDRVMGLAMDASGHRYYATGVNESAVVNSSYPPLNTYRSNIVRVVRLDPAGNVQFNIDLDTARHAYNSSAEMIINPMTFSTSRLAVGGNEIALVHGINTAPDWNINGARHQKALSTRLDATSGAIARTSSAWVSHSFDQRLLYDGEGIIEHHLGDAYPRDIVFARHHTSHPLFYIKGSVGENNTRTRLGNVALIEQDPTYRYIALFVTENSSNTGSTINGPRNLAIVRVKNSDNSIDPGLPDTLTVSSGGTQRTNRLRWLTHYSAASRLHAERPKLVGIGGNRYIVLWEEWLNTGSSSDTFNGVYGMVIDDKGTIVRAATLITREHHLHRGDDAFLLDHRAAWMTGNAAERKLYIHFVDESLRYAMVTLD